MFELLAGSYIIKFLSSQPSIVGPLPIIAYKHKNFKSYNRVVERRPDESDDFLIARRFMTGLHHSKKVCLGFVKVFKNPLFGRLIKFLLYILVNACVLQQRLM